MKRLFLIILFVQFVDSAWCQTFLNENFSNGIPASFTVEDGGTPSGVSWDTASWYKEGSLVRRFSSWPFAFVNGDNFGVPTQMDDGLSTPVMNTSSAALLFLEYTHYYRDTENNPSDSARVEVFDGTGWRKIHTWVTTQGSWSAPKKVKVNITQYKNTAMKVRFRYFGDWPWWWAMDNLKITAPLASDASVSALVQPASLCSLGINPALVVKVANYGIQAQAGIPVFYRINAGTPFSETVTTSIPSGGESQYTFTNLLNFTNPGIYKLDVWTKLPGDQDVSNDSIKGITFVRFDDTFPAVTFSGYDGTNLQEINPGCTESRGVPPTGILSSWQASSALQQAALGSASAKVNLFAKAQKEFIFLPPFKPVSSSGFSFDVALTDRNTADPDFMGSDDQLKVQVSTNCGVTWQTTALITLNASSGLTNQFKTFQVPLASFAGQEIRLAVFATDGSIDNDEDYDIHVDNIKIINLPPVDLGIVAIKSPVAGCSLPGTTPVTVSIRNYGSAAQTGFPVKFKLNNQTVVSQDFSGSIAPGQVVDFTFTTPPGVGNFGNYTLSCWTQASGDASLSNDSLKGYTFFNNQPVSTFPYYEDFEAGAGNWIPGGAFSSWAMGTPQKSIINSPAGGQNSWVTGGLGAGTHNSNEASFVSSPCFDFTNLNKPVIEMKVWWHSEWSRDGAILQYTTNGGTNWYNVGTFGDPNNWYNDNTISALSPLTQIQVGWTGGVGTDVNGSGTWVTARNFLTSLGGNPTVKFRIGFGANASINGDGFGFDEIRIYESPTKDISLESVIEPSTEACSFSANNSVKVRLVNKGRLPVNNIPVFFRLGNGAIVSETISQTIDTGSVNNFLEYTFNQGLNMAAPGGYQLSVWCQLPGDNITNNDSIQNIRYFVYSNALDTVDFEEYNGANLNLIVPGSREGKSLIPTGSSSSWTNSNPAQTIFLGSKSAKVNLFSSLNREWLIMPSVLCEPTTKLSFRIAVTSVNDITPASFGYDDSLKIMVSPGCSPQWVQVYSFTRDSLLSTSWKNVKINLSQFAGQRIQIGFYATDGILDNINDFDLHLDKIVVFPSPAIDLAVTGILNPLESCGLGSSEEIKVRIYNNGANNISSYTVFYQVNASIPVSQSVTTVVNSDAFTDVAFQIPYNFTPLGNYRVKAWVAASGDLIQINDTFRLAFSKYSAPTPPISFNGFDGQNLSAIAQNWRQAEGFSPVAQGSKWKPLSLGSNSVAKVYLSGANIRSWMLSPGIKLSLGSQLRFKAALRLPGTNTAGVLNYDDKIRVLVSPDCGITWDTVFVFSDTSVVNVLNEDLQTFAINLEAYDFQEVKIAFLASDGLKGDLVSDFLIDDIAVLATGQILDVQLVSFVSPPNPMYLGQSYPLKIKLRNVGTVPISNFLVQGAIGESNFSAFVPNAINAGTDYIVTFEEFFPSVSETVQGYAIVSTPGDTNRANDTLRFDFQVLVSEVENMISRNELHVYPNPTSKILFLKSEKLNLQEDRFTIISCTGQKFMPELVKSHFSGMIKINLPSLPEGIYTLHYQDGSIDFGRRFLISK